MFAVFAFVPFGHHQTENDAVPKRMRVGDFFLVEEHRADRKLAIEPTASLVECFADEVGWKLVLERLGIFVGVSPLRKGHGTAVVPAIDDFGDASHARAGFEWRVVMNGIDVRFVDTQVIDQFWVLGFGLKPDFCAGNARLG